MCGHEVKGHVHDHRGYAVYAAQVRSGEDEASGGGCGIDPINTVIIHQIYTVLFHRQIQYLNS